MPQCDACKAIVGGKRSAPGHDALERTGSTPGPKLIGQAKYSFIQYTCKTCGTQWEYENDRNDLNAGWSLK